MHIEFYNYSHCWTLVSQESFACLSIYWLHFSGGIQFATAQLPLLELMDCGMTICDPNSLNPTSEETSGCEVLKSNVKMHLIYQKLIIKHSRLKKLSLWGCSGLDVRFQYWQLKFVFLSSCFSCESYMLI